MKKVKSWYLPEQEEPLVKYVLKDDGYQAAERSNALRFVKHKGVALDVGAHVGLWARDLCQQFHAVICFEPIPEHFECLENNLRGYTNYKLFNSALSDKDAVLHFKVDPKGTGGTCVTKEPALSQYQAITLDSLNIEAIDFIKLDCEGWEEFVLKGGMKTILKTKPIINVEQRERKKGSAYVGADTKPYGAVKLLESWGAVLLSRFKAEYVFGWNE